VIIVRFGDKLRELRQQAGMTQWQIAERTGVSNTYISALESGRKPAPPHAVVTALAACLEVKEKTLWDLAQREREERLRRRINGVPTSQRVHQDEARPAPEPPTGDAGVDRALRSLKAAVVDPKQRRSLANMLDAIARSLREDS